MTQDNPNGERSQRPVWLGQDRRGWDHARIHRQVLEDVRLGAYEVGVYVGLAMHAETMSGECFPAEATLATYLGCSDRQVRRALVTLRDAHYIETDSRPGKATVYRLLPPPTTASTLDSQSGVATTTPDSQSAHPGPAVRTTPDSQSDEQEPVNENQENERECDLPVAPPSTEVVALCREMGAMLSERGYAVTKGGLGPIWLRDMDRLLRIDGRTSDEVQRTLRWLDNGEDDVARFWRSNVRSPAKLREKWVVMAEQYAASKVAPARNGSRSDYLQREGALPLDQAVAAALGVNPMAIGR